MVAVLGGSVGAHCAHMDMDVGQAGGDRANTAPNNRVNSGATSAATRIPAEGAAARQHRAAKTPG